GHERQTGEALARALPDAYVSLSSAVLPQIKEFERVSTTIVNAYVGPVLSRYLARLESRLAEAGYRGPTLIIQSHGGVAPIAEAGRLAAGAVLSGPAGGAAGSVYASRLLGEPNLIPFDMGGTSTDICLVVDGQAALVMDRKIAGHRIALGSLDIASIGAGGGSIARVDAGSILHVGPESAGAAPGPACYGQGGAEPTVTDANLVLGYLDPANFLGGARQLGLVRVIVPRVASVLSAWGMLATDLRFELSRTHIGDAKALDGAAVKHLFDEMQVEGLARLRASFAGPARAARSVDMRYGE